MLKNISCLGDILSEKEQKTIQGGHEEGLCPPDHCVNTSGGCTNPEIAFVNDCA